RIQQQYPLALRTGGLQPSGNGPGALIKLAVGPTNLFPLFLFQEAISQGVRPIGRAQTQHLHQGGNVCLRPVKALFHRVESWLFGRTGSLLLRRHKPAELCNFGCPCWTTAASNRIALCTRPTTE